jgi:hypothetical protein
MKQGNQTWFPCFLTIDKGDYMKETAWYRYACLVTFSSLVLLLLSFFIKGILYAMIPLFILVAIEFVIMINALRTRKFSSVIKNCAKWTIIFALASVIFALINFCICGYLLRYGGAHIDNGVYCLWNHGFVREITRAEYDRLILVEQRMISGHIHAFSAIPPVIFSAINNKL